MFYRDLFLSSSFVFFAIVIYCDVKFRILLGVLQYSLLIVGAEFVDILKMNCFGKIQEKLISNS